MFRNQVARRPGAARRGASRDPERERSRPGPAAQYDTDVSTWSPQGRLFQVEYAMEAVKQGSAAVGLTVSGTRGAGAPGIASPGHGSGSIASPRLCLGRLQQDHIRLSAYRAARG